MPITLQSQESHAKAPMLSSNRRVLPAEKAETVKVYGMKPGIMGPPDPEAYYNGLPGVRIIPYTFGKDDGLNWYDSERGYYAIGILSIRRGMI